MGIEFTKEEIEELLYCIDAYKFEGEFLHTDVYNKLINYLPQINCHLDGYCRVVFNE